MPKPLYVSHTYTKILYSSGIWHNFEMYLSFQHPSEVASTNKQLHNFYLQMLRCNEVERLGFGFAELDCAAEEGAEFVFLKSKNCILDTLICSGLSLPSSCSSQSHSQSWQFHFPSCLKEMPTKGVHYYV